MCAASRTPHTTVSTSARPLTIPSPAALGGQERRDRDGREAEAPRHVDDGVPAQPQRDQEGAAEDDDDGEHGVRHARRGTTAAGEVAGHQAVRHAGGRPLRPSGVGLTIRIWSTPIRPSSKASAPPTR